MAPETETAGSAGVAVPEADPNPPQVSLSEVKRLHIEKQALIVRQRNAEAGLEKSRFEDAQDELAKLEVRYRERRKRLTEALETRQLAAQASEQRLQESRQEYGMLLRLFLQQAGVGDEHISKYVTDFDSAGSLQKVHDPSKE